LLESPLKMPMACHVPWYLSACAISKNGK